MCGRARGRRSPRDWGCIDASQPVHVTPQIQNGTAGPGLWRSLGGDECVWTQRMTLRSSWRGGDMINTHTVYSGPVDAQILDHAGSFTGTGCSSFWLVGTPWDRPLATPGQPFGAGDYRVGGFSSSGCGTWTKIG
jgi:hypothetical protein